MKTKGNIEHYCSTQERGRQVEAAFSAAPPYLVQHCSTLSRKQVRWCRNSGDKLKRWALLEPRRTTGTAGKQRNPMKTWKKRGKLHLEMWVMVSYWENGAGREGVCIFWKSNYCIRNRLVWFARVRGQGNELIWQTELINELVVVLSFKMLTHARTMIQTPRGGIQFLWVNSFMMPCYINELLGSELLNN